MKQSVLLSAVILMSISGISSAQEHKLGVALDVTYVSKWMSRGREVWSEDGGFFETLDLDLWGTGFGTSVMHRSSTDSGWVNKQRLEYAVYYKNSLFDESAYKTNYKAK